MIDDYKKLDKLNNTDFLIQIANNYARDNEYFLLADLVKNTYKILKDNRDKLDPPVIKVLDHYLNK
jgi:hypothetical protein